NFQLVGTLEQLEQYPDDLPISNWSLFDAHPTAPLPNFAATELGEPRHDPIEIGDRPRLTRTERGPPPQRRLKIALGIRPHGTRQGPDPPMMFHKPCERCRDRGLQPKRTRRQFCANLLG